MKTGKVETRENQDVLPKNPGQVMVARVGHQQHPPVLDRASGAAAT
jgi:hypothetical protein